MRRRLCFALLLIPSLSLAAVHRVPSEHATIQAGIDACLEGDTVLVAPGTYTGPGNRDLHFDGVNRVLLALDGVEDTVIDCEGEACGFRFDSGVDGTSLVSGFTILRGLGNIRGGGIYCVDSSPYFRNLRIERCRAAGTFAAMGGGAFFRNSQSRLQDVTFAADSVVVCGGSDFSTAYGGGICAEQSDLVLESCQFLSNYVAGPCGMNCCSSAQGAGIHCDGGSITVRNSLFAGNSATLGGWLYDTYGGGICIWYGDALLEGLTFVGNTAEYGSAVYFNGSGETDLQKSILSFSQGGEAVEGGVDVSCSLFWNNAGNDADYIGLDGNFSADPRFCDVYTGDYHINLASPCLPENNDCGVLIGALSAGCEDTPVFLAGFRAAPRAGAVDLSWQLGGEQPSADFELRAEQAGVSRSIPWHEVAAGSFAARDESASLAIGGQVTYQLSGRLPGESWQLLRSISVDVPPARGTRLLGPYPNPFNPATELTFHLAEPGAVSLAIYDLTGRRVAVLAAGLLHEAGPHTVTWAGRDDVGRSLASGLYFARFTAGGYRAESKLVLLK